MPQVNSTDSKINGAGDTYRNKPGSDSLFGPNLSESGKMLGDVAGNISQKASRQFNASRNYVRENPVKGVAIAAATGVVLGSLMTFMGRRNH